MNTHTNDFNYDDQDGTYWADQFTPETNEDVDLFGDEVIESDNGFEQLEPSPEDDWCWESRFDNISYFPNSKHLELALEQRKNVLDQIYTLEMHGLTPLDFKKVSCERTLLFTYLRDWDEDILNLNNEEN